MSRGRTVDIVREAFAAFKARAWERMAQLTDPEVEFHGTVGGLEEGRIAHGLSEIIKTFENEDLEAREERRLEPEEFIDAGDEVVVLMHEYRRGRGSGVELENDTAVVFAVRDGRVVRIQGYMDQSEALEAAGLFGTNPPSLTLYRQYLSEPAWTSACSPRSSSPTTAPMTRASATARVSCKGWLEAREIETHELEIRGLPVLVADVGPADAPLTVLLHGHLDVVPGHAEQFEPRARRRPALRPRRLRHEGGAGGDDARARRPARPGAVRVRLGIVPDEESEEELERGGELLVASGFVGDFAITGEPTDMHVGVAAKGVFAMRIVVEGRAAHGATPWLGDNAILRAIDVFRAIESLPFAGRARSCSTGRRSTSAGSWAATRSTRCPTDAVIDVDVRYLPEQDPDAILAEVAGITGVQVVSTFTAAAGDGRPRVAVRARALRGDRGPSTTAS